MDTADSAWVTQLWMGAMVGTESDAGLEFMNTMNPTDYNTPEMIAAAEKIQKMYQNYTTQWQSAASMRMLQTTSWPARPQCWQTARG